MTQFPVSLRGDEERVYQALWGKGVIGLLNHKGSMKDMVPESPERARCNTVSEVNSTCFMAGLWSLHVSVLNSGLSLNSVAVMYRKRPDYSTPTSGVSMIWFLIRLLRFR